ncbi:MAG TPA: class I SAM-dependent methyltransferase [Candidatus Limnocylindrales bacterium]|nr:class I SAM-dependent methyltransferase [Candidatus Limnocylindrales bacterium]
MSRDAPRAERPDYDLLDAGDGRRLERFGERVVDRPAPAATGTRLGDFFAWRRADLRFDPGGEWIGAPAALEPWPVAIDGLTLELRPTASGGLGIYPEHAANLAWVTARVRDRVAAAARGEAPQVLNLFAHTGLVTLAAARAGAAVAHVDASNGAVDWARRNASLSGLDDRPVRWLVDDAGAFVAREARRGRRYDGVVLDPPSFGRAGRRQWKLAAELPTLLAACRSVAADDAFVLLTSHTTGLDGAALLGALREAFGAGSTEVDRLTLEAESSARLELGWAVRRAG